MEARLLSARAFLCWFNRDVLLAAFVAALCKRKVNPSLMVDGERIKSTGREISGSALMGIEAREEAAEMNFEWKEKSNQKITFCDIKLS